MHPNKLKLLTIIITIVILGFQSSVYAQNGSANIKADSISLTAFIRNLYKWHSFQIMLDKGFDPKKGRPSDTFYKGIDFEAVNFMIRKLRMSGYFDDSFLENYRIVAMRMDKELKKGTAVWREGALPPFNGTDDPWCDCGDSSVKYWANIKLSMLLFSENEAKFKLNVGGTSLYQAKAKKLKGSWKITYLEGFDFSHYKWAEKD